MRHLSCLPPCRRALPAAALTTASALLLTACGGSDAPKSAADAIKAAVPKAQRAAGVLRVGSDLNYAPVDFRGADGDPDGLDPDLANALGKVLGLRIEIVDTTFDKLIPGLNSGQFDVAMSAISDTAQRRDALGEDGRPTGQPGVDFVDYFIAGTAIIVQKGNPKGIRTLDDICGRTVAVQRGSTQDEIIGRQVAACGRQGKPLEVHRFDNDSQALAEVAAGRAVADFNDFPVAAYAARTTDGGNRFEVTGAQSQSSPYGIAVNKSATALRDAVAKGLDQLIRSGEYDKILAKWNVSAGAAQAAAINGGL
ncbi:ABC transporter substrate-binding protein [Kitasatospora sp. NBC_01246]|uniref:ABC transporter substrate-binding protein n=1 Tax=Kitasatospora sp. NBC_01246 TaxID=2903570 RepID=UPI002E324252|nr:ABC transporter substrate-binding protein [Kitasatospora sp. NBC_01246]